MPGKVKVRILAGRNLPVMDKSSDTSDAFVEVRISFFEIKSVPVHFYVNFLTSCRHATRTFFS